MYARKSRLSGKQRGKMIEMFVAGATARAAAEITGVNRNTVRIFYQRKRQLIDSQLPSYELSGEVEADESYFGGVRKGKRGGGAAGKIAVFWLLNGVERSTRPSSSIRKQKRFCRSSKRRFNPTVWCTQTALRRTMHWT